MTHEERARALWGNRDAWRGKTNGEDGWVQVIAAAFTQVEAEAKRECKAEVEAIFGPGPYELAKQHPRSCPLPCGTHTHFVAPDPGTSGLPAPKLVLSFCCQCGKKPCESFIECATKSMERCATLATWRAERDADGGREAVVQLRACTCGAASCGSRIHSDYCDSFGIV